MAVIDELKVIDGYFEGGRFIMRGIGGHAMTGAYKADGLRALDRAIGEHEPFTFVIDEEKMIHVPLEINKQLKKELNLIADTLENN